VDIVDSSFLWSLEVVTIQLVQRFVKGGFRLAEIEISDTIFVVTHGGLQEEG
jgi:hypothetical protein